MYYPKAVLSLFLLSSFHLLQSQEIRDLQVSTEEGKIIINYTLVKLEGVGKYTVKVGANTPGGMRFELRSVSGDVGMVVRAGTNRKIIWDAGKDVQNTEGLTYWIEAVPMDKGQLPLAEKKGFVAWNADSFENILGFRMGMLNLVNRLGFFAASRFGSGWSITGGANLRFTAGGQSDLYGYAGLGLGCIVDEVEVEGGLQFRTGALIMHAGAFVLPFWDEAGMVFGIGVNFNTSRRMR